MFFLLVPSKTQIKNRGNLNLNIEESEGETQHPNKTINAFQDRKQNVKVASNITHVYYQSTKSDTVVAPKRPVSRDVAAHNSSKSFKKSVPGSPFSSNQRAGNKIMARLSKLTNPPTVTNSKPASEVVRVDLLPKNKEKETDENVREEGEEEPTEYVQMVKQSSTRSPMRSQVAEPDIGPKKLEENNTPITTSLLDAYVHGAGSDQVNLASLLDRGNYSIYVFCNICNCFHVTNRFNSWI